MEVWVWMEGGCAVCDAGFVDEMLLVRLVRSDSVGEAAVEPGGSGRREKGGFRGGVSSVVELCG